MTFYTFEMNINHSNMNTTTIWSPSMNLIVYLSCAGQRWDGDLSTVAPRPQPVLLQTADGSGSLQILLLGVPAHSARPRPHVPHRCALTRTHREIHHISAPFFQKHSAKFYRFLCSWTVCSCSLSSNRKTLKLQNTDHWILIKCSCFTSNLPLYQFYSKFITVVIT